MIKYENMKYKYDLHLHSDWSDGDYSLAKIFQIAKKNGLHGFAITDHNVIASDNELNKLKKECHKNSVDIFEGIEMSATYKKIKLHILGYAFNFNKKILRKSFKKTVVGYTKYCGNVAKKLEKFFKLKINFNQIRKERGLNKLVTKHEIAKAFNKVTGKPISEIFALTKVGGPGYLAYGNWAMNPFQVLKAIKRAGGIVVMAHLLAPERSPFSKEKTEKILFDLVKRMKKQGLDGLEVHYPLHTRKQEKILLKLAKKYNLLISGGSDWHGEKSKPSIKMGMAGLDEKQFIKFKETLKK
jgi:3',5'-nucleoside bisphosphate phosphatase